MNKTGVSHLAASFLTTDPDQLLAKAVEFEAWIDAQVTSEVAQTALMAACQRSNDLDRVLAVADEMYAALENDPPTVTSITPATGTTAGGTAVTIVGTNFTGATVVTIGGTTITPVIVDDTHITGVTPAKTAGAKDLVVTTPAGTVTSTGAFTYA